MRITYGVALFAATFIVPLVAANASAQITRIDFQVVESPAFDGQRFGTSASTSAFGVWLTEKSTPTMCGIVRS